jgi:molybdopterin/thiamine biosynthesis adenylyltransferase
MAFLPRIKDAHRPVRAADGRILIGSSIYGVAADIVDDDAGTVWRLIELMDGTRDVDGVVTTLAAERPGVDTAGLADGIRTLVESGFVEDHGAGPPARLSQREIERYSRSTAFFEWADVAPRSSPHEIQCRLKDSRVAIVGVGGSGSAVAMSLVATGVGSVACYDFDRVEESNLNRQLLYTEDDLGQPKVHRAVDRLRRLNSHVLVTGAELRVTSADDLVPVMRDVDLCVLCADTPADLIQAWTNTAALRTGTPWLVAMHGGPMVVTGIYQPGTTPCYQCAMHGLVERSVAAWGAPPLPQRTAVTATIAPTAMIAGHLGALEAIYFLAGMRPQTVGRQYHQNLLVYDHQDFAEPAFWDDCPACGPAGEFPRRDG